jgi:hypothetical protein
VRRALPKSEGRNRAGAGVTDAFENRRLEFIPFNDYPPNSYVKRSFYLKLTRSF